MRGEEKLGYIEDRIAYKIKRSPMCPVGFHEMSSLVELGVSVGPRVYMDFAPGRVYFAPKTLAIAGSTRERKTTGYMTPTIDLLGDVFDTFKGVAGLVPDHPFDKLADTSTPEGFFSALKEICPWDCTRKSVYWTIDEYSRYFASQEKAYMSDSIEALLVAMDGRKESRGLSGKTHYRGECNLCILSAAVRESYERVEQPWHFTSGLIPRHLVRIGTAGKHCSRPLKSKSNSVDFVTPVADLIKSYYQPEKDTVVDWAPDAQKAWDRWCARNDKAAQREDVPVQVIHARAEDNLLNLAMGYAISDTMKHCDRLTLELKEFRAAARRIAPYIKDAITLYYGCGQRHVVAVRRILRKLGKQTQWYKASKMFTDGGYGDLEDFELAIRTLEDQDEITVSDVRKTGGRPGRIITTK